MTDRRLTPATDRIALESLRGVVERPAYTPGRPARLSAPLADLCRAPDGARDRQTNFGADLTVLEERNGWAFVQAVADGYCGWVRSDAITQNLPPVTHRVSAPATHVYAEADIKSPDLMLLSMGARLSVVATQGRLARLAQGGFVPLEHISQTPETDPAEVAERMLGTPYLWGGNSRSGIDCSGLVQGGLRACAIPCPGDSDMQENAFPVSDAPIRRGDLLFWKGHVAMALDDQRMIHANGNSMSVLIEPIAVARERIEAEYPGTFRGVRRPDLTPTGQFP